VIAHCVAKDGLKQKCGHIKSISVALVLSVLAITAPSMTSALKTLAEFFTAAGQNLKVAYQNG
jgi:hypothetical protein